MTRDTSMFRRLRGIALYATAWGIGWGALSAGAFLVLRLTGVLPDYPNSSWLDAIGIGVRFGVVGALAGAAFATAIRKVYRGRRLANLRVARFAAAGAALGGIVVPAAMEAMNWISGDGSRLRYLVDDIPVLALFGAVAAGGSLWLAQRGERSLLAGAGHDAPERLGEGDALAASAFRAARSPDPVPRPPATD